MSGACCASTGIAAARVAVMKRLFARYTVISADESSDLRMEDGITPVDT
jgi:hypothetical protein